jgi:hypothetical protein
MLRQELIAYNIQAKLTIAEKLRNYPEIMKKAESFVNNKFGWWLDAMKSKARSGETFVCLKYDEPYEVSKYYGTAFQDLVCEILEKKTHCNVEWVFINGFTSNKIAIKCTW